MASTVPLTSLLLLAMAVGALSLSPISCPTTDDGNPLPGVPNLSIKAFTGKWFEISKTARLFASGDVMAKCFRQDFSIQSQGQGMPAVLSILRGLNNSMQSTPVFGPVDVTTAIFQFNRGSCSALDELLSFLLGRNIQLPNSLDTMERIVSNISVTAAALSQGQVDSTSSITSLGQRIKDLAASLKALVQKARRKFRRSSYAYKLLTNVMATAENTTLAAELAKFVELILPQYRTGATVPGTASQEAVGSSRFTVTYPVFGYEQVFTVLAVGPLRNGKYTAALMYACTEEESLIPRSDIIFLSRSRTLSVSTNSKFLEVLEKLDVRYGCDNPILSVYQDPGPDCMRP